MNVVNKTKKKWCPYAQIVPLKCDVVYRLDEFYRQLTIAFKDKKESYVYIGPKSECNCNPEICSRYIQHLIKHIKKYKNYNVR